MEQSSILYSQTKINHISKAEHQSWYFWLTLEPCWIACLSSLSGPLITLISNGNANSPCSPDAWTITLLIASWWFESTGCTELTWSRGKYWLSKIRWTRFRQSCKNWKTWPVQLAGCRNYKNTSSELSWRNRGKSQLSSTISQGCSEKRGW